jgi:predicted secreted hydrolase
MKKIIVSIAVILLFLGSGLASAIDGQTNEAKNRMQPLLNSSNPKSDNPWTPADEGDHFPTGSEYWWLYTMLTLDDGRHWDMCAQFFYTMNWTGKQWSETKGKSYIRIQSWDRETGEHFDCLHVTEHPEAFQHRKNMVDLKFYNSTMKGLYPDYTAHFDDDIDNIQLNVNFHATTLPHWCAQDALNGWIPCGTGIMRYGCIPLGEIKGNLSINGTTFNVTGVGYHEHQYADYNSFTSFKFTTLKNLSRVLSLYSSFAKWWLSENINNGLERTHSLHLSTDNLLGYDWIWIAFDNGWSMILYRLVALGVVDGHSTALLMLTDGKKYWEIGDIYIKIIKETYLEESDMYLPLDFEITGFKKNIRIDVIFNSTTNMTKVYASDGKLKVGNFLVAGEATGSFTDGEKTVPLNGNGTNTPLRFIPRIKHRSLDIDLTVPPNGLGITIKRVSHKSGLERFFELQLRPTFEFMHYIKHISDN